jgi:hypothetical protein
MSTVATRLDGHPNWNAAEQVSDRLGVQTRKLVAERDEETAREWALRMASQHHGPGISSTNESRAASYLELAVLLGHEPEEPVEDDAA